MCVLSMLLDLDIDVRFFCNVTSYVFGSLIFTVNFYENSCFWLTEKHLIKINITSWIIKPHVRRDGIWQRVISLDDGWYSKKYRLRKRRGCKSYSTCPLPIPWSVNSFLQHKSSTFGNGHRKWNILHSFKG